MYVDGDPGAFSLSCVGWDAGQMFTSGGPYDEPMPSPDKIVASFAYNGIGSIASRSNWAYTYDFAQGLVQAKSTSPAYTYTYSYDGAGRKVKEVDAMASTYTSYFAYLGSRLACTDNASSGVKSSFVYLGDQLLFRKDSGSATGHFYATDLSNNVRLVWNFVTPNNNQVNIELKQRYKPFGELATTLNTPTSNPRFRYAEQSYSSPTKLYAMGARSYAPDLGRFTSRDPVSRHGYAYAADNPLSFWDPSGKDAISDFFGWLGNGAQNVAAGIGNWWNGLDPNVRGAIIIVGVASAIIATGGLAAGPLAGMAVGTILGTAAIGAAVGAVSSAAIYTGVTLATGGTWSLEGMAQATAIGALIGGVTAGAGKAFELWRAGELFAADAAGAADGGFVDEAAVVASGTPEGVGGAPLSEADLLANFDNTMKEWNLEATLRNWDFFDEPYPDTSAQTLGDFLRWSEEQPLEPVRGLSYAELASHVVGPIVEGFVEEGFRILYENSAATNGGITVADIPFSAPVGIGA